MFHLKFLKKENQADLAAIKAVVAAHPNRKFTTLLEGYHLPGTKVKELLQSKCGVCIHQGDNYSKNKIQEFITLGKDTVILRPKDFTEADLKTYLQKGASIIVGKGDGFDVFQIKKMVVEGKEKTFVMGGQLLESHIKDYLKTGGSVLLKKGDLTPFEITRLLPEGKNRIHIHTGGFSNFRIEKFLKGGAVITFGKGNQIAPTEIEAKVNLYKNQIQIDSEHFNFDVPWVKKMESLGAVII